MTFAAAIVSSGSARNLLSTTAQQARKSSNSGTEQAVMLIHAILPASRVNGPGLRAVLFVQGCSLACKECWNIRTHPFKGNDVPVANVLDRLLVHVSEQRLNG